MKKALIGCLIGLLLFGFALLLWGTIESYSEFAIRDIKQEFIGYISEESYSGSVTLVIDELPAWCATYISNEEETLTIALPEQTTARLGLFVDFTCYDYVYEKRNMITGQLKTQTSEQYYRPNGQVAILPVLDESKTVASFDHQLVKFE